MELLVLSPGMQQELLGAIPGEWQSPGMQQEPSDVSRGMWGWLAAQGGSLGAHTLLWHLRGVASPLITE